MPEDTATTKLKMHTPDFAEENIAAIAKLFPGCVTEATDEDGSIRNAIDFDLLRQELSGHVVDGPQERYHLNWPGKREALLAANAPIAKTLRPCRDESVAFDTTRNLFIEGDNLEALKLVLEAYVNMVDVVYIDPPYNRGADLLYRDDYTLTGDDYLSLSQQEDDEGNRLVVNVETNGRFHSDWLSSVYPRIRMARTLLSDSGVFFMSISDVELANAKKLCDEVFGEANFVECYIWNSTFRPDNSSAIYRKNAEFVLCYARDIQRVGSFFGETIKRTGLPSLTKTSMKASVLTFPDASVYFKIADGDYDPGDKGTYTLLDPVTVKGGTNTSPFRLKGPMIWGQEYLESELKAGTRVIIKGESFVPYTDKGSEGTLRPTKIIPSDKVGDVLSANAELRTLMGVDIFDYPKPVSLIAHLISMRPESQLVLDFYAGSGTTVQAVFDTNVALAADKRRRVIAVQMPEPIDPSTITDGGAKDTARRAVAFLDELSKPHTVAEIAKERIRRAGTKLRDANSLAASELDTGFRVLKVASSNMKNVFYRPDEATPDLLGGHIDNIKDGRTDEDLLFQVLLDWGVDLSLPFSKETVGGKAVYFVDTNALAACFEAGLDDDFVKELAKREPLRVVFRDSGYGSDDVKINVEQIFKQLSPGTEVKTL